ncbi:MAG: hypothetical protein HY043_05910 [Verrucomicrobia bacterium]|nr:hypothetical protein [Verrucomicrobiota bacterium]
MKLRFKIAACALAVALLASASAGAVDFEKDISLLLVERGVSCHGEKKQKALPQLDRRADAMKGGENPYRELPVRAIRLVFCELTPNHDLPDAELRARLGRELFSPGWQPAQVDDLFFLFQVFNTDRDWSLPGALTTPGLVRHRAEHGRFDTRKRVLLRDQLARVQAIAARHRDATSGGAKALQRIAQWLADQWTSENAVVLN